MIWASMYGSITSSPPSPCSPERLDRLFRRPHPGAVSAVRGGEVGSRASLAGEEDPVVDLRRENRAIVGPSRQRVGIGAAREGIHAPLVRTARRHAAREFGAEQSHEFGDGEIQEGGLTALFEFGGQRASEITFDQ